MTAGLGRWFKALFFYSSSTFQCDGFLRFPSFFSTKERFFFVKDFARRGRAVGWREGEVTAAGRIKEFRRSSTEVTQDKTPSVSRREPLPPTTPQPPLEPPNPPPWPWQARGRRGGGGCVRGHVRPSEPRFTAPHAPDTLPFCLLLLVNGHGEGERGWGWRWGHNSRLQGTINLDTSYHCLPLQGGWGAGGQGLSCCKHD